MRVHAEFPESTVFRDRGYFRYVSSSIPSGSSRIPMPKGHLSHPRHPQLSVLHRRESSDQRRAKTDRKTCASRKRGGRKEDKVHDERGYIHIGNSFWFRYANISPSIVTPPATSGIRDSHVRMHLPSRPIGQTAGVKINNVHVPSKSSRYVNSCLN